MATLSVWENSYVRCLLSFQDSFSEDLSSITDALGPALTRLTSGDPAHGPGAAVSFAADLLDLFCQFNWTGPPLADFTLPFATPDALSKWNAQSLQSLSWNGEPAYPLVQQPLLLWLAHTILVESGSTFGEEVLGSGVWAWWALRCLFVEQKLLDQRSATLWSKISQLIGQFACLLTIVVIDISILH